MSKKLNEMVAPELFKSIEDGNVTSENDLMRYLEVRNDVIKGLSKLKRGSKMDVYDAAVGGKGMPVPEFLIAFEYKGMNVVLKGLIGVDEETA